MKAFTLSLILFVISLTAAHARKEVETVARVEIDKYLGTWNELYRVPNSFQDNSSKSRSICFNTVAEYALLDGERISVKNTCTREEDGKIVPDVARAIGSVVDRNSNAKLTVNFTGLGLLRWLGIGDGDYWILGLGPVNKDNQYEWALVGSPSRKYGWILARRTSLSTDEISKIYDIAETNGYSRAQFSSTQRPR